jgi:hypothetical protein
MQQTLRHHGQILMFEKSKSYDDMVAGKMLLYNLDLQEKIAQKIIDSQKKNIV